MNQSLRFTTLSGSIYVVMAAIGQWREACLSVVAPEATVTRYSDHSMEGTWSLIGWSYEWPEGEVTVFTAPEMARPRLVLITSVGRITTTPVVKVEAITTEDITPDPLPVE